MSHFLAEKSLSVSNTVPQYVALDIKSIVKTLSVRKVNSELSKELEDGTFWETDLWCKGAEETWQLFNTGWVIFG